MKETFRIGSRVQPTDPYWVLVRENMRQRVQEMGIDLVNVNLPLENVTGEAQLTFLDDLLAQELDALITHRLPETLAHRLVAAGLPLIFTDEMDYSGPGMTSPRGLGEAAVTAAHFLVDRINRQGTVAMIGGEDRFLATVQCRTAGFLAPVSACPGIRCIHVPTMWRYEEAYDVIMEDSTHWRRLVGDRPLAGIFGISDSLALAGRDAFRLLGLADDSTQIVGINGDPLAVAAIIAGTMHATVETSAWDLARKLLDFACQAARGRPLPAYFPHLQRLVTAANAAQVAAEKLVSIADVPSRLVDVNLRREQQRLVQMQTSLELNRRVGSILDGQELLGELADIIRTRYDFDHVQLFWWRETDGCLVLDQPVGGHIPGGATGSHRSCLALEVSGALGQALMRNQAIYIPDTLASQRFAPDPAWPDCRSRVILPIRVGGKTLGVLDLHSRKRSARSQIVLDALQTLADQLGIALRNAQLYAQALEAKAEAERASLLKSRLLANVSHELRTPLNIILGYSQIALSEPNPYEKPLPDELRHDLHHIQRSGQHLVRLVEDLLNLSQAEIGALELYPELIDTRAFLTEVFDSMAGSAVRADMAWQLQLPATLPSLQGDPVRLRQVLLNLLDNAARFTARGHITLGAVVEAPNLHIWVEDTGVGTPPSLALQVRGAHFSPEALGENGTPDADGMSLGLSVAIRIAALHGGRLWIESQAGHGTVGHVYLPLVAAADSAKSHTGAVHSVMPATMQPHLESMISQASDLVQRAAHYMREHYASDLTRSELAAALGLSPDYVSRVFRCETGMSLKQYLVRYRVAQAQQLLQTTPLTITQIAYTVGFDDSAYFSRVFHQETGKTPRQYRKITN